MVPTVAWVTVPSSACAAGCGAPENWLSAPVRLERAPPPRRPLRSVPPSFRNRVLPPLIAPLSFVKISGSDIETASDTFWAPPGAAAAVPSEARIAGHRCSNKLLRHRFIDAERPRQAADQLRRKELGYETNKIDRHELPLAPKR